MRIRRSCVLPLLLATAPLPSALTQEVAIRTDVYRVEITIAAEDSKRQIPGDLKPADFRVWDNGKEQSLASLELLNTAGLEKLPDLPPNTYANRFGSGGRPQILSMILLDAVNTHYRRQPAVRQAVANILAGIAPDEKVAVFTLGTTLRTLHDFSSDRETLLRKIAGYRTELTIFENEDLDDLFASSEAPSQMGVAADERKILHTLEALEQLANYVKGVPGRKNLIWLSGAFPLAVGLPDVSASLAADSNPVTEVLRQMKIAQGKLPSTSFRSFQREMDRTVRALNAANVVVYPVDSRGLSANPRSSINHTTMNEIARETGGTASYDRNDIDRAVRSALDDSRVVYLLTYAPKNLARDGAYHQIRLQTTRPGLQLRYRRGYYAPESEESEKSEAMSRLERALASPLDSTEIGIRTTITRSAATPNEVTLLVTVNARDVELDQNGGQWSGALRLEVVQRMPSGDTLGGVRQEATVALSKERYQQAMAAGLQFRVPITCGAGAIGLRIGVLDERSGRTGSLAVPIAQR